MRSCSVKETVFMFSKVPVNNLNLSDSHQSSSLKIFDSNNITFFSDGSQTGNKCLNYKRKTHLIHTIYTILCSFQIIQVKYFKLYVNNYKLTQNYLLF